MVEMFPGFPISRSAVVDLNSQAKMWSLRLPDLYLVPGASNPLLDPYICQQMVEDVHRGLDVDWSYGGYLEYRSFLWAGSYLEETSSFIHVGVDFNVPP